MARIVYSIEVGKQSGTLTNGMTTIGNSIVRKKDMPSETGGAKKFEARSEVDVA